MRISYLSMMYVFIRSELMFGGSDQCTDQPSTASLSIGDVSSHSIISSCVRFVAYSFLAIYAIFIVDYLLCSVQ